MGRDSFILYTGLWEPIRELSNEQLGRLFRAIYEYQVNGEAPELDPVLGMAFGFFKNQFDLDLEKYRRKVENIRNNASGSRSDDTESDVPSVPAPVRDEQVDYDSIVRVLFFRNIPKAEMEAKRYVGYYQSIKWTLQGGQVLTGYERVARAEVWTPLSTEQRFPTMFLGVWSEIFKVLPPELRRKALKDRTRINQTQKEIKIYCHPEVGKWILNEGHEACKTPFKPYLMSNLKITINQY